MSFELTSNAPPADWQQFQELFRETEYTDDSDNHFNYCTICLYIIPDLAQAKLIDAQVRDQINKTLYTNIELGGLVCGYCYDNYAKSTADQSSWPIAEDDLMSIDDTLFDPEKEQLDQAAVKHHLQPSATTTAVAYATNNSNAKNSAGVPLPGLYNVVETSEFFHSHESDSHVLNYSEHDYDTSYVTDSAGISDLSSVLPVDVTFSAPAQLYHPHVTPYWTEHVTNHVTDQRVTPVKRRDLNEIASMKLPELKTELKKYRLSTKGTKPQLVQRLFRHLSLFHSHVPGHVPDNAPFIFAELQDGNETAQPWSMSRDRPNESLTALFEDDRSEQESYLALKERALVAHQARDTQPLDLSSLSLLSLPEIKARLAQYTGASIKGSKAELIQRLVRYSCLFAVPK